MTTTLFDCEPKKRSKKNSTPALVEALQEAGEDFQWYPTTDAMIGVVSRHLKGDYRHTSGSILDIGAGDGRVLIKLAEAFGCRPSLYAIEKAPIHIENMPADIAIVGTDFHCQTLIDKQVEVIFCNPPYSEFEQWATKIVREALCKKIYLILPQRWAKSNIIKSALESREAAAKVLWSGDFTGADRKARAVVDILCVAPKKDDDHYYHEPQMADPFDTWFSETFPEVEVLDKLTDETKPEERISGELLVGYNLVDRLVELYQKDMEKMYAAYRSLCSIDPAILKTVGVKVSEVKEGLKSKIKGLKNLYWQELFDHLDKVTARLTTGSRKSIVDKMSSAVHVDFTSDNAYAVVLWVLKNANLYIESQLVDLFRKLSKPEHIINYKSNQKTWKGDGWRYMKDGDHSHYMLDYRIISMEHSAIYRDEDGYGMRKYDYPGNLHQGCHNLLRDIRTVANNLGFVSAGYVCWQWESGKPNWFYLDSGEELMRVKAFMNGNVHLQLHQGFIKALNIEASRLLGWIKSPQEAVQEMDIDFETAKKHFESNRVFKPSEYKLLTA